MNVVTQAMQRMERVSRRPQQTFNIRSEPWEIAPFMIAPVLPGETLKNILLQSRVVSDPVVNRLLGWWKEYYFFYCKHRDLDDSADFQAMMLDADYDLSGASMYEVAASVPYYHHGATVNWLKACHKRIVEEFFRDEGETWNANMITNYPAAKLFGPSRTTWLDSVVNAAEIDPTAGEPEITVGVDDKITASEIEQAQRAWEFFRAMGTIKDMSYEDFLASYGVKVASVEEHKPELVRYVRQWTYPVSAIDATDGSAANALVWPISERADKDRYFKEPGFIVGVTVARPKVYLGKQNAAAVGLLKNAYAWLPALLRDDPMAAFQKITDQANSPLSGNTDDFWVDLRDLFLYGDQFVNFDISADLTGTAVALPTAALVKDYATQAMARNLFADNVNATFVREDGIVHLNILGTQVDHT